MVRIKAILFLVLFSFSAVGNAIEIHYCKGQISGVAFFSQATCEMELESAPSSEKSSCHKSCTVSQNTDTESKTIKKPTCCHSEKWIFPEENAVKNDQHLTSLQAVVLVHFFPTHLLVENTFQQPVDAYLDPDPTADLQVLFQSFLI